MALLDYLPAPVHPRRWLDPSLPVVLPPAAPIDAAAMGVPPPPPMSTRGRTTSTGPAVISPAPPVQLGAAVPAGASNLQRLMAERTALANADPSSQVRRTSWGYEELPPEQSPSRGRQGLAGVLQGANIAAQASGGDPWATLAGAATGGVSGGVSPRLLQAFTRQQELDRNAGNLANEQAIALKGAQVGETFAQAEQRRLEPYLRAEELRAQNERFEATERGRNERAAASNRTRVQTATTANELRGKSLEETMRHNRAVENKPGTATEEITVAGRTFRVSANTAARILEERSKASNKERTESQLEAELEDEAANDHLAKRKAAEERASVLRAERDKLSATKRAADTNKARITELDRQIAQEEVEARYRQKEADDSFVRARKARAKGTGGATQPAGVGRTIEGAVEAFKAAKGRMPTAEEIARMKRALGQ